MTITRSQYLQLVGLLTLAARHNRDLRAIEKAALEITKEDELGHTGDAVYGDSHTADSLLERLSITVEDDAAESEEERLA